MSADAAKKPKSSWLNLVVDFGPLLGVLPRLPGTSLPEGDGNSIATVTAVIKGTIAFMGSDRGGADRVEVAARPCLADAVADRRC
ncbi:hypothetical protein [Novosphingobium resinovorum]|uniref:hypothetical protein n=1 Tax=Novosphingobium resinovorum TaxID=158500 RepID=UPI003D266015